MFLPGILSDIEETSPESWLYAHHHKTAWVFDKVIVLLCMLLKHISMHFFYQIWETKCPGSQE